MRDDFDIEKVCDKNETAIFSHQNKLKKIWISAYDQKTQQQKVIPLLLNENGEIADKKWRDFANLHKPIDTCLSENMAAHRNNMIKQYDENCANGMYRTVSELSNNENYVPAEKIDLNKIYKDVYGVTGKQQIASMSDISSLLSNQGVVSPQVQQAQPQSQRSTMETTMQMSGMNSVQFQVQQPIISNEQSEQYDKFMESDSYKKLYSVCMGIKDKDRATYDKVVGDWNAQHTANPAQHEIIVKNIIAKYKQDLMPYVESAMNNSQTITQSNSQEGQTYGSMSNNDKKTFLTALRTGGNMISGEGFKEASARIQQQQTNTYSGKQTLSFVQMKQKSSCSRE